LPGKAGAAMERHPWPGNVRQFEMVVADALSAAVYAGAGASIERSGRARIPLHARILFHLLSGPRSTAPTPASKLALDRPRPTSVAGFRWELERAALRALFE